MKVDIILSVQFGKKIGYGHLKRILIFYKILKDKYKCILATINNKELKLEIPLNLKILNFSSEQDFFSFIYKDNVKLVILDYRYYKKDFVIELSKITRLILIDASKMFPGVKPLIYLNILTPLKFKKFLPLQFYYSGLAFYPIHKKLLRFPSIKFRNNILITFGNSDPNNLTLKILKKLNKIEKLPIVKIVLGKYFDSKNKFKIKVFLKNKFLHQYQIIESPENIYDLIYNSKYIITSFGLTFIEGLILNKNIGLYNNSMYHTSLAKNFKEYFSYIGTYPLPVSVKKLVKFINAKKRKDFPFEIKRNNKRIIKIIDNLFKLKKHSIETNCKICGGTVKLILNQFERKIYECNQCKVKYLILNRSIKPEKVYKKEYFTEEYKKQYGVTYLNDRENIIKLADKRLKIILKYIKSENKNLLDIGCAYGFFLEKAREKGFDVAGIEIEKKAAIYAKKKLNLNVINKNFFDVKMNKKFDVITMWYVMEHFDSPERVLQKLITFLKPNGMICISVPNGNGSFYKFNRNKWLSIHPDAHFFDYSIKSLKILFKKFNLKLIKRKITGIHPERIGITNKFLQRLCIPIFKSFNLGDTMELYFKQF